jgi:hypothetical protein
MWMCVYVKMPMNKQQGKEAEETMERGEEKKKRERQCDDQLMRQEREFVYS